MEFSFLGKRTRYLRYGSIPTITIVCDERLHSCWREHWENFPSGRRALISQSMMHIVYTTAAPFAVSWVQVVTCIHGWCIYLPTHRIKKYILLSHCWNPAVDTGLLLHEVGHIWGEGKNIRSGKRMDDRRIERLTSRMRSERYYHWARRPYSTTRQPTQHIWLAKGEWNRRLCVCS